MTAFAIVGFGEVGGVFARDLRAAGVASIVAFDIDQGAQSRAEHESFRSAEARRPLRRQRKSSFFV